jgi:hypothetical protein
MRENNLFWDLFSKFQKHGLLYCDWLLITEYVVTSEKSFDLVLTWNFDTPTGRLYSEYVVYSGYNFIGLFVVLLIYFGLHTTIQDQDVFTTRYSSRSRAHI